MSCRRARDDDPAIRALRDIVAEVWNVDTHTESNALNTPGSNA
jgi:hypothetical protein